MLKPLFCLICFVLNPLARIHCPGDVINKMLHFLYNAVIIFHVFFPSSCTVLHFHLHSRCRYIKITYHVVHLHPRSQSRFSLIFSKWFLYICFLVCIFLLCRALKISKPCECISSWSNACCINSLGGSISNLDVWRVRIHSRLVNVDYNTSSEDYILLFTFFFSCRLSTQCFHSEVKCVV